MIPLKDNIPSKSFPIVNYLLISANTVLFVYEFMLQSQRTLEQFIFLWGLVPLNIVSNFFVYWKTFFTSMFLHGGFFHFLGNMLFLYIFGDNVEDKLGHIKYFIFYIVCGLSAGILQTVFSFGSKIPMVGASGAIAGVLGAYFLLFPQARVLTLIPMGFFTRIVPVPAFFFLGFWFLFQTFSGTISLAVTSTADKSTGGIAFWAHIGGFITGMAWIFISGYKKRKRTYYQS